MAITKSGDVITVATDGAGTAGSTLILAYTMLDVYNADVGGNWNVVHKQGNNQYKADCNITVGGSNGTTYFKFIKEDFLFCGEVFQVGGGTMPWHYYPGIVHLGEMVDGEPVNGSTFTFGYTGGAAETKLYNKAMEFHLYNSQIKTITAVPTKIEVNNGAPFIINRGIIDGITDPIYDSTSAWMLDIDNSVIQNASRGIYMEEAAKRLILNNLIFKNCTTGIYNYGMGGITTFLNLKTKNTPLLVTINTSGWTMRLVNPEIETWHVDIVYPNTYIQRAYEFGLKVVDVANVPIVGAAVEIKDLNDNVVVDMVTDVNGLLIDSGTAESSTPTSLTDNDKSWTVDAFKGYLIEITAGTGAGQIRGIQNNTATTIRIGSGTTNWWKTNPDPTSEYRIIPVLDYGYMDSTHGDNFIMKTPHTMKIKHYKYTTLSSKFEVATSTNWAFTMATDPWITKNETQAGNIGGTCNP